MLISVGDDDFVSIEQESQFSLVELITKVVAEKSTLPLML